MWCADCGYELSGLEQPRCPECGHVHTLEELSHQANFEAATWYLTAGWGLFFGGVIGIPVGLGLAGLGVGTMFDGVVGAGLAEIAAGMAALSLPIWAGCWLRGAGSRMNAGWGGARWLVAASCWLPCVPMVMGAVEMVGRLVGAVAGG